MANIRMAFISCPRDEAKSLAKGILEERLGACVNIIPKIESLFWWEGKIQKDEEALLIVKTTQIKAEALITFIKDNHPYDVPEVITVQLAEGLPDYLDWVAEETARSE